MCYFFLKVEVEEKKITDELEVERGGFKLKLKKKFFFFKVEVKVEEKKKLS